MVKINVQNVLAADFRKVYGLPLGQRIKHFWKKGWNDVPELLACIPIMAVTVVLAGYVLNRTNTDKRPTKYYSDITIFRVGDPRIANIRKDETLIGERTL